MKILLYLVLLHQLRMGSHSLPLMLNTLLTLVERRRDVKEIENVNMVVVVAIGTGTGTGIETETGIIGIGNVVIVIGLESQMTITTSNHGRGSMHEMTITSIEAMISMPNLDGMKMSIVLGIVIVMSAIGIGTPDQRGRETGNPGRTGTGREIETETGRETEETETEEEGEEGKTEETEETEETGREKGRETGIETERGETKTEETGKENEETGTERKIERNLIIHIPRHIMKARHRRRQPGTLLDPSSKKCLLLTLTAMVFYLNIQKQKQELDLVGYSFFYFSFTFESLCLLSN